MNEAIVDRLQDKTEAWGDAATEEPTREGRIGYGKVAGFYAVATGLALIAQAAHGFLKLAREAQG